MASATLWLLLSDDLLLLLRMEVLAEGRPHTLVRPPESLLGNDSNAPGHGLVHSYICGSHQRDTANLMVAGLDNFHHADPWPPEDRIVRGCHVDHIKLSDDIVRIGGN